MSATSQQSSPNGDNSRGALRVTWAASVVAVLMALANGIRWLFGGSVATYDAMIGLTALTVISLAWYTYFTREALLHARAHAAELREREEARRVEERESLSTAVLAELALVSARLKTLCEQGPRSQGFPPATWLAHPMLQRIATRPELFRPQTVQAVTSALTYLRDVGEMLDILPRLRESEKDAIDAKHQRRATETLTQHEGRTAIRAGWAYNRAVSLVERLRNEGGLMPIDWTEAEVPHDQRPLLSGFPFVLPPSRTVGGPPAAVEDSENQGENGS